jgi:hypothetical protein
MLFSAARRSQARSVYLSVKVSVMRIDASNYEKGNKAMAAVLLLYYHLANSGGFIGDETVYIDRDTFDGYSFLDVVVCDGYDSDIDQKMLREGAVIYLLCDLNDMVGEFEESFLNQDTTKRIMKFYKNGKLSALPETKAVFQLFGVDEEQFDFRAYSIIMHKIINLYVIRVFNKLAGSEKS